MSMGNVSHCLACVVSTFFLFCSTAEASSSPPLRQVLRGFIADIHQTHSKVNGGAIAIVYGNHTVHQQTFGFQKGNKNRVSKHTLFPLASCSKPVAATTLAMLVKEKKLHLNQPIYHAFPQLSPGVRLKHLLSHSTGYTFAGSDQLIEKGYSRKQLLRQLTKIKPSHAPGQRYHYSNTLFSLTEDMISQTTKQPWERSAMRLWERLNQASHVRLCEPKSHLPIAYPHVLRKGKVHRLPLPPYYPKAVCSSAGVFATIEAMAAFIKLHLGYRPDILTRQDLAVMHRPQIVVPRKPGSSFPFPYPRQAIHSYYALGWRIVKLNHQERSSLIYHTGHIAGINTFMGFLPSLNIGIVILTNQHSSWAFQKGFEFWARCLNAAFGKNLYANTTTQRYQ